MKYLIGMLVVIFLSGCATTASFQRASAGKIGCPPDQIEISDLKCAEGDYTWIATCKGKRYVCSSTKTSEESRDISCAPEAHAQLLINSSGSVGHLVF